MKPGIKTTEFWVHVAVQGVAAATAMGLLTPVKAEGINQGIPVVAGLAAMVVGALGYSKQRANSKDWAGRQARPPTTVKPKPPKAVQP